MARKAYRTSTCRSRSTASQSKYRPAAPACTQNSRRQASKSKSFSSVAGRKNQTVISSRKTTGAFTRKGAPVRNVQSFVGAGGTAYSTFGKVLNNPKAYAQACQQNSIMSAARRAERSGKAFSYHAQDAAQGRHYVGYTKKPTQRIQDHLAGKGAQATKQMDLTRIDIRVHKSTTQAKASETKLYHQRKKQYGIDSVRGAGHTKRFDY